MDHVAQHPRVAFGGTDFLKGVPNSSKDKLAQFPEKFPCASKSPMTKPVDFKSMIASGQFAGFLLAHLPLYYVYASVLS